MDSLLSATVKKTSQTVTQVWCLNWRLKMKARYSQIVLPWIFTYHIIIYKLDLNCVPCVEEDGNLLYENPQYEVQSIHSTLRAEQVWNENLANFVLNSIPRSEEDIHDEGSGHGFDLNSDPYEEQDVYIWVEHRSESESEGGEEENGFDLHFDPDDDFPDEESVQVLNFVRKERNFLSNGDRSAIYRMLLNHVNHNGRLERGITTTIARSFEVSRCTIQRIWSQGNTNPNNDVSHKKGNCGRKRNPVDIERIHNAPLKKRTSLRSLPHEVGIPIAALHRLFKLGFLRRHSNPIKPFLKDENLRSRLSFCISMLEESSLPHDPLFKGMYNTVHIDEKWFMMSKKAEKYYLTQEEENPHRTCKSKNFITKVMFLVALARPRFDSSGKETFDGKLGVFPFVTKEPAKRSSVNRAEWSILIQLWS